MKLQLARSIHNLLSDRVKSNRPISKYRVKKLTDRVFTEQRYGSEVKWIGGFIVESLKIKTNELFAEIYIEFYKWRVGSNEWYLIISTDTQRATPLIEIRKHADQNDRLFNWSYSPSKHDGRNEERKTVFKALRGSLDVKIDVPISPRQIGNFLNSIYTLAYDRLFADAITSLKHTSTVNHKLNSTSIDNIESEFDPASITDAREKTERHIIYRRGQQKFREELIVAYDGKCAITGCTIEEVLEAAHIIAYQGDDTNTVQNGLLLRADIHTLWDKNKIGIDPETSKVHVSKTIHKKPYGALDNTVVSKPNESRFSPSKGALEYRWREFQVNS